MRSKNDYAVYYEKVMQERVIIGKYVDGYDHHRAELMQNKEVQGEHETGFRNDRLGNTKFLLRY